MGHSWIDSIAEMDWLLVSFYRMDFGFYRDWLSSFDYGYDYQIYYCNYYYLGYSKPIQA